VVDSVGEKAIFAVPAGAFGNLFGGYLLDLHAAAAMAAVEHLSGALCKDAKVICLWV